MDNFLQARTIVFVQFLHIHLIPFLRNLPGNDIARTANPVFHTGCYIMPGLCQFKVKAVRTGDQKSQTLILIE